MTLSQSLLPEFDQEMAITRKTLERIPEEKLGWKPHEKSMTLGRLAGHLADLPGLAILIIRNEAYDVAAQGRPNPLIVAARHEALDAFDRNIAAARTAIAGADDEHLLKVWSFSRGDQTLMAAPRIGFLRRMVLNHIIHHRAQLGVYLRLNNIPVPATYGPSADENPF